MNTSTTHQQSRVSPAEPTVELEPELERAGRRARDARGRSKLLHRTYLRIRPVRAAVEEAEHVYELEQAGESEWTPWIVLAALTVVFAVIGLLMFGIVEGVSHLLATVSSER